MSRVRSFLREAKRRRIYTTALAYGAVSVGIIEFASSLLPAWGITQPIVTKLIVAILVLAFPMVLVLAWIFDIGRDGIHRTTDLLDGHGETRKSAAIKPWARTQPATQPHKSVTVVEEAPDPDRVRRATLAFVRHELRTPVNAIIGYSEMLQEDAEESHDTAAAKDLERIGKCGREILKLLETGLSADLIAADHGRNLESFGEQIRADLRDPLSAIVGYTEMLIETSRDSGLSQRESDLERILSASNTLLNLSSDIAALAMHAPEAANAQMVRGASMAHDALSKIRAVQYDAHETMRTGSLLVVDDSAVNRDLLAKQLARKGYLVATAPSGIEALERMQEQAFDCVLLDVLMPDLDGVGVLLRMKNDQRLARIPVIMISALDEVDSIVRCLELGATDFVSKPFHPTLLDARIQAALHIPFAHEPMDGSAIVMDASIARIVAGMLPDYTLQRIANGDLRQLDGAANAAACFVDLDYALGASDPAERARHTENLIGTAREVCASTGARVLMHGIGMVMVAGFPETVVDAPQRIARTALLFMDAAENAGLRIRAGVHVGSIYAALVGEDALTYWAWGEAIDLSRRLAISADRGTISLSATCQSFLKDEFNVSGRGVIDVPGRGQMRAYALHAGAVIAQ